MANPSPSLDGIGIANLPNQVCENPRSASTHRILTRQIVTEA